MIEQTKQEVEHKYCVKNGYEHDAVVSNIFIQWLYIIHSFTKFSSIPKKLLKPLLLTIHFSINRNVRSNKI